MSAFLWLWVFFCLCSDYLYKKSSGNYTSNVLTFTCLIVRFTVTGVPRPKGSMRAFLPKGSTRPIITASNPALKTWEQAIRNVAQPYAYVFTTSPVRVSLRFSMQRPKNFPKKRSRRHTKRPDIDKLSRAALDALTGILWADDSQVYSLHANKIYALSGEAPSVKITVTTMEEI